ncbi:MAG: hypothetical protein LJE70_04050 [Chromatiaceae bacterium]|nr:hypothetical protein [Chromatiaceae bacterium]
MKPVSRFFAVLAATLLCATGPVLSGQYPEYGRSGYPGDFYPSREAYGVPYGPYGDRPLEFRAADGSYVPSEAGKWAHDGYRWDVYRPPGSDAYLGHFSDDGYPSYPLPDDVEGYRREPVMHSDRLDFPPDPYPAPYGYSDHSAFPGERATAAPGGYGVRGDRRVGYAGWGTPPWQQGYRFRPLTEQERGRMDTGTGWRPKVLDPVAQRLRGSGPVPAEDTFGYQPDSWTQRYRDPLR